MKLREIIKELERLAPPCLQESYDNSGLIVGNEEQNITQALISLDVTHEVLDEAIGTNVDLIISHHPMVFSGLKRFNGNTFTEKLLIKAIKNDIAVYSIHTNLDNIINGVNSKIAEKLGLKTYKILSPKNETLEKISVYVPKDYAEKVRNSMFDAGAGTNGNYDCCSFNSEGFGSFRAGENSHAFVGEKNKLHFENEIKIETIVPQYKSNQVIKAMTDAHPYEEIAFERNYILNKNKNVGSGMYGELPQKIKTEDFLTLLKTKFHCKQIKHSKLIKEEIQKIAFCGGSGSFLIQAAKTIDADIFITGDIKYHDFFEADEKIIIVDIGHYESEQFTKDLIFDFIKEIFSNFAVRIFGYSTNPINYF